MPQHHLPLSDLERIGVFVQLIDRFPHGHPLKRHRGDVYYEIANFQRLFRKLGQEAWLTEALHAEIDLYLAQLEPIALNTAVEWTEKLKAALHEYDNYKVLLAALHRYEPVTGQPMSVSAPLPALNSWEAAVRDPAPETSSSVLQDTGGGRTLSLLKHPLVAKIVVLLDYLVAESEIPGSGEAMLFELLHGPWFDIPARHIIDLALEVADRQYTEYTTTLRRLLFEKVHAPASNLFSPAMPAGMQTASNAIEKLVPMVDTLPIPALLDGVLQDFGIAEFVQRPSAAPNELFLLDDFRTWVEEESARNEGLTLSQLVKLFALSGYATWADSLPPLDISQDRITVLGSLYQTTAPSSPRAEEPAIATDPFPVFNGPTIAHLEPAIEQKLLQRFAMHATALNSYIRCPLEFYYNILVRTPFPRNEATEFGSAVHFALEMLFKKMQSNHEAFPDKAAFLADFESYMHRRRASFTGEQLSRRLAYGREVLSNYYDEYADQWNTIVTVERNFRNVIVGGVPLKGKIDKLEFDGRMVNLVDYKTGDPDNSMSRLVPPSASMPYGGDYWRQAVFYKILVDNYQQKEWKVSSAEFDFIEPDKRGVYHKEKLFIEPSHVETVTQQFTMAWQRIRNREFYTGCGKPACHWCRFVKSYGLEIGPHQ